jgi:LCP family protein required for cell wall assembly
MSQPEYHKYTIHDTLGRRLLRGLYSALVPGTGQLAGGAKKRGFVMLGVSVALLVAVLAVVIIALRDVDQFAAWMIEPSVLVALLVIDIVLLLYRLYAVIDAMRALRTKWGAVGGSEKTNGGALGGSWWQLWAAAVGAVVLLAFIVTPHVVLGYSYVYKAYDTLTEVFADDTTTTVAPSTTTLSTTTTLWTGSSTASTETTTTIATTTTTGVPVAAGDDGRLTIMFIGSDAGVGRSGARADTTIVASFNLSTGQIALLAIPRNTGSAPVVGAAQEVLGIKTYPNLISSLYAFARLHPELDPAGVDSGAIVMRDTVSTILGIPIDYYAVVDMLGFVELVDILGGVDVNFEKKLHLSISPPTKQEETLVYDFEPGVHHLDGRAALAFARTRHDSSDYVRMGRQRCVIAAVLDQTVVTELVWNFPAIMDVFKKYVRTNIPIGALQQLLKLRSSLKTDQMITVGFTPPKYTDGLNERGYWILDYKLIQETVKRILENPEAVLAEEKSDTNVDSSSCWKIEQ